MAKRLLVLLCLLAILTAAFLQAFHHASAGAPSGRSHLLTVDDTAPDDRIPLILVHGINPIVRQDYSWRGFLQAVSGDERFQQRYKTYLFVFDPARSVRENGHLLRDILRQYRVEHPKAPPFRFVALSLGGLVVRDALYEPSDWAATDRIIVLGAPFHGSPLANPAWIKAQLKKGAFLNPVCLANELAYGITRRKFPHFQADYCWDNFDESMPPEYHGPNGCIRPTSIHFPHEERHKYIVYAGFFGAGETEKQALKDQLPNGETVPEPGGSPRRALLSRHMLFSLVRPTLAALPRNGHPAPTVSMMAFNDGISPISSQLWLGRFVARDRHHRGALPPEKLWQALRDLQQTGNARLFDGLDHRDWLEGKTRYRHSDRLADWLNPDEPPRTMFEWIREDLMREVEALPLSAGGHATGEARPAILTRPH